MAKTLSLWDSSIADPALRKNMAQAFEWATRYVDTLTEGLTPIHIEGEFVHDDVMIHPDLVAWCGTDPAKHRTIIDYKTTADPYIPAYHQSMQLDLYAYVLGKLDIPVQEIAYHVISDKIYESTRPPDARIGEYVYEEVRNLELIDREDPLWALRQERPYYQAGRTGYWEAEMQYREDGLQAALDYMDEHMEKEEDGEGGGRRSRVMSERLANTLVCPGCDTVVDGATYVGDDSSITGPSDGDISICLYCQEASIYTGGVTSLRLATIEEMRQATHIFLKDLKDK